MIIYNNIIIFRYIGVNQSIIPVLIIKDPELIKQIAIKDFDHFAERQPFTGNNDDGDPLWSRNLFGARGGLCQLQKHLYNDFLL